MSARLVVLLVVLALAAVGCGGGQPEQLAGAQATSAPLPTDVAADQEATSTSDAGSGTAGTTSPRGAGTTAQGGSDDSAGGADASTDDGDGGAPADTGDSHAADESAEPADPAGPADPADASKAPPVAAEPDMDAVEVSAVVAPECVKRGGTVTITVQTSPNAGVAYVAMYSDGQAGGPPPYGANYGGNDGGMAGEQGRYSDTWTVAANAPTGKGSVDVLVGTTNSEYGETSVPFAVADPLTGVCK